MSNCIIRRLKESINDENLYALDEFVIDVDTSPSNTQIQLRAVDNTSCFIKLIGGLKFTTNTSSTDELEETEYQITTTDRAFYIKSNTSGKIVITKINKLFNIKLLAETITHNNRYTINAKQFANAVSLNSASLQYTNIIGDISVFNYASELTVLNLTDCGSIYGDISSLKNNTKLTEIRISNNQLLYGNFDDIFNANSNLGIFVLSNLINITGRLSNVFNYQNKINNLTYFAIRTINNTLENLNSVFTVSSNNLGILELTDVNIYGNCTNILTNFGLLRELSLKRITNTDISIDLSYAPNSLVFFSTSQGGGYVNSDNVYINTKPMHANHSIMYSDISRRSADGMMIGIEGGFSSNFGNDLGKFLQAMSQSTILGSNYSNNSWYRTFSVNGVYNSSYETYIRTLKQKGYTVNIYTSVNQTTPTYTNANM